MNADMLGVMRCVYYCMLNYVQVDRAAGGVGVN